MSFEQAKAFIEKMTVDEEFREQIIAIDDFDERMAVIKAAGFDCTADEIDEVQD
ncbi:MAG: Nif11-like leader peptide family RiPP precursor [Planctomycetota bacterium]